MRPGDRPIPQINGDVTICIRESIPGSTDEDELWLKGPDTFKYLQNLKEVDTNTITFKVVANELQCLRGGKVINSWPTDKKLKKTELWVLEIAQAHRVSKAKLAIMTGESASSKGKGSTPATNTEGDDPDAEVGKKKGKKDSKEVSTEPIEV